MFTDGITVPYPHFKSSDTSMDPPRAPRLPAEARDRKPPLGVSVCINKFIRYSSGFFGEQKHEI
jgi:hypothetical protein